MFFHLHFSLFKVVLSEKKLFQFPFEKITCCGKRENNLLREKITAPGHQMVHSGSDVRCAIALAHHKTSKIKAASAVYCASQFLIVKDKLIQIYMYIHI